MYEQLKLNNQLCFRLYTVSRLITQSYHPMLEPLGLTYPQYLVLMVLWEQDHQLVSAIGRRLMLETNTLTPLLQRMERDGLIVRTKGIADGRQTLVSLTKNGQRMEERCKDIPFCMSAQLGDTAIEAAELERMVKSIDSLIEILSKKNTHRFR